MLCSSHEPGKTVIYEDGHQDDGQIAGIEVTVKPQGHSQQESLRQGIAPQVVQPEVAEQAKGEEDENENVGIEKQAVSLLTGNP